MEEFCAVDIQLNKNPEEESFLLNERITGEVVIVPKLDLDIEYLDFRIIIEKRGKTGTSNETVHSEHLTNHSLLHHGNEYRYPVSFTNDKIETFEGKHVSFLVRVEVYIKLHKEQLKELDPGFLKRTSIGKLMGSDKKFKKPVYLKFTGKGYKITSREIELVSQKNSFIVVVGVLIIGAVIFGFLDAGIILYLFMGILGVIASVLAFHIAFSAIVGKVTIAFQEGREGTFKQVIKNEKGWKNVNELVVTYAIMEEVVDDRGSSSTTYTQTIFESPAKKINHPSSNLHLDFDFPENAPITTAVGDSRIYWQAKLKIKSILGTPITFKEEFVVERGR